MIDQVGPPPEDIQRIHVLDRVHDLTVGQFYREVAKLGGFLGRKGDGDPGWITIWRGWEKVSNLVKAASLVSNLKLQE